MVARKGRSLYKFVKAPPKASMRRRSKDSAPRLYEWLISEGYVEPVSSTRASRAKRRRARRLK